MDPHPTPFRAKRRSVAAPTKTAAPKPKSVATARGKMAKKSPNGNAVVAPQPRPRRAFGTVRSSNSLAEKPPATTLQKPSMLSPPLLQKPSKVSPPPVQKPSKVSPPPVQKPSKVSPPPMQKPTKVSPRPMQKPVKVSPPPLHKPSKLSPPNPIRATRTSRPAAKPLKKACPGPDLEAKAKKKSQRVSFRDNTAAVAAPGSGEKVKAPTEDAVRRTPMVSAKALERKSVKAVGAETPFFSAQNCSSCTLDQLESASYWLAQIRLAESVGKHRVAAAFFGLAFECQAQPFHRIQSELRSYIVRHESASTLTLSFDELLLAHGMPVNQPKFDSDGSEKVLLTTNVVEEILDATTPVEKCSECDCGGDLVDVGEVNNVKLSDERIDQPSFGRKLDETFEFDDCEAVIVDQQVEEHSDIDKNVGAKVPPDSEIIQSACSSCTDKLSLKGSPQSRDSYERRLSSDSHLDKLSPSARSSSAARLSSDGPSGKKSPFDSCSLKKLTSSCPSYKKSSIKGVSLKWLSSGGRSDGEHNVSARAGVSGNVIQEGESDCHAFVDQLKSKEQGDHAAIKRFEDNFNELLI